MTTLNAQHVAAGHMRAAAGRMGCERGRQCLVMHACWDVHRLFTMGQPAGQTQVVGRTCTILRTDRVTGLTYTPLRRWQPLDSVFSWIWEMKGLIIRPNTSKQAAVPSRLDESYTRMKSPAQIALASHM